ncbi:MAG: P-loop domain-containing protein, partial [Cyanobacteria bacterium P01_C01_bin.118]
MTSHHTLEQQLDHLDGQSYSAYKGLKGTYGFPEFELTLAHVQGDPFAAPSRVSIWVSHGQAQIPVSYWREPIRQTVLADFLHRRVSGVIPQVQQRRGSGKSGQLMVASTSQVILARTAVQVTAEGIELRLGVGLPAFGRRIAGKAAKTLLTQDFPKLIAAALYYQSSWQSALELHMNTVEDANAIRSQLAEHNLMAFIANGSILPRQSGVDSRPLADGIPFKSPPALEVALQTPHTGIVRGLGIPAGVTLIVGGGYHGKSTVLKAIAQGAYNHIPGDGRDRVVANAATVK